MSIRDFEDAPKIVISIADSARGLPVPKFATLGSAGLDLSAAHGGSIGSGKWELVKTGLSIALPEGYEAQIRSRSGLALKRGVVVLNSPGTIDSDYRGEIGLIMINFGPDIFHYKRGDRLAQMVIAKLCKFTPWFTLNKLDEGETERGAGGYGSTGVG